jgi:hypothetical protein
VSGLDRSDADDGAEGERSVRRRHPLGIHELSTCGRAAALLDTVPGSQSLLRGYGWCFRRTGEASTGAGRQHQQNQRDEREPEVISGANRPRRSLVRADPDADAAHAHDL